MRYIAIISVLLIFGVVLLVTGSVPDKMRAKIAVNCPDGQSDAAMHQLWGPLNLGSLAGPYTEKSVAIETLERIQKYRDWVASLEDACLRYAYNRWIDHAEMQSLEGRDHPFDWAAFNRKQEAKSMTESENRNRAIKMMPTPPSPY